MGFLSRLRGEIPEPEKGLTAPTHTNGVFEVKDTYQIIGVGIVAVGTVVSGTIKPGQCAVVNGKKALAKSMEANHKQIEFASQGQNIGINLKGISKQDIQPGAMLNFT